MLFMLLKLALSPNFFLLQRKQTGVAFMVLQTVVLILHMISVVLKNKAIYVLFCIYGKQIYILSRVLLNI